MARPVAASAGELLAHATNRTPMSSADGKSAVPMERVVIDDAGYVVKQISPRFDWISRATGDYGCRALACWRGGLLDDLPACLDHTIVGVAYEPETLTTTLLMRDVGDTLVPEGSEPIALEQHRRFIDHMAQLHAAFWDRATALPVLTPMTNRYATFSVLVAELETARPDPAAVPGAVLAGWAELQTLAPDAAAAALAITVDPWPLVAKLDRTPQTLVHADWKLGNLGSHPDGRTVLLDWQWPGTAPATVDLAWYLGVNCDRIPESKEQTIAAYRESLERHGIATDTWFDDQLELCLLGAFAQLGWNKTHDRDELAWWIDRVLPTTALLT